MAMGNGADPDAAKVHEDYQSAPAGAHKNQQGPRNVSDPDLFEPRISIANSIAEFTRVRAAVGPGGSVSENPYAGMDISRNAPCPCGSGNKYKHCHGAISANA